MQTPWRPRCRSATSAAPIDPRQARHVAEGVALAKERRHGGQPGGRVRHHRRILHIDDALCLQSRPLAASYASCTSRTLTAPPVPVTFCAIIYCS